ncbi:MAG: DUF63 family protein [Euryarchaeota archaeon]|nr:DUF63 family protein [Euryarchaeota archaeon]
MDFFREYFIDPIYQGTGYNAVNTVVYGLLLGLGIMAGEALVERLKVRIDRDFLAGVFPYLVLASVLRSLVDASVLPRTAFLITPGIFFTIFLIAAGGLGLGLAVQERTGLGYHKTMGAVGLAALPYPVYLVASNLLTLKPLLYIMPLFLASSGFSTSSGTGPG